MQLCHVVVGILTPTSAGKAAALLSRADPAAALAAYERSHVPATGQALANRHPRPLDDDGLQPLAQVPAAMQARLDANAELMAAFGIQATPAVIWRDARGELHALQGVPEGELTAVLGPR